VGELAYTANLNQGKAFSLFGLASAIGYVMGPLLGGFLSNSGPRFGLRGPLDILVTYPFLLPCLVSAYFNVVVFGMSIFWLDETNQKLRWSPLKEPRQQDVEGGHTGASEESDPLLGIPDAPPGSIREDSENTHSNSSIIGCLLGIVYVLSQAKNPYCLLETMLNLA
jgi:MFS family permease